MSSDKYVYHFTTIKDTDLFHHPKSSCALLIPIPTQLRTTDLLPVAEVPRVRYEGTMPRGNVGLAPITLSHGRLCGGSLLCTAT